jgi:N-acetylmuramoyl-L-alanine amidase
MEKNVTLTVALELKNLLVAEGATVYMTRTRDTEVSPKKGRATAVEELQARCDIANAKEADIFISIHMDSFTNDAAKGTTGYYYAKGSRQSRDLADKVRQGVIDQIGTPSRGTQSCNFYVVKHTDMPATLVELAFISNRAEEKLLHSDAGVKKAAQGILDGIEDYFN